MNSNKIFQNRIKKKALKGAFFFEWWGTRCEIGISKVNRDVYIDSENASPIKIL